MGSMMHEEYATKFLELLRRAQYLADEKAKVERFVIGFPLPFINQIEYDEPQSLEGVTRKLNHFYEQSKHNNKSQHGWKGKEKGRCKWKLKRKRPQHTDGKENVALQKRFNQVR